MLLVRSFKLSWVGAIALIAIFSVSTNALADLKKGTFMIGWASDKTSYLSFVDEPLRKGMVIAVEEINAKGGIGGKLQIKLDIRDMKADPMLGGTVVQELVAAGAHFIVTTCDTDVSLPGAQIAVAAKLPVMSSCGADAAGPSQVAGNLSFLNVPGTLSQGAAMAEYAYRIGHRKAYTLKSKDEGYTQTLAEAFEDRFKELGGEIVGMSSYSIGDTNFRVTATKMVNSNADVLMSNTFPTDTNAFLKDLARVGNKMPLLLVDGNDSPAIFDSGPQLDLATMTTYGGDRRPGSPYGRFVSAYQKHFNSAPGSLQTALGYDLIKVVEAAVLAANSTEGQAIANAIDNLENVEGATGMITYKGNPLGSRGLPRKEYAIVKFERQSKEFKVIEMVFPTKIPVQR